MIAFAHALATDAVALGVAAAAICRLAGMHLITYGGVRHQVRWVLVYMCMLLGAIAALDEAVRGRPSTSALLLLFAVGGYLWHSRLTWRTGPPEFMRVPREQRISAPFGLAAGQSPTEPK